MKPLLAAAVGLCALVTAIAPAQTLTAYGSGGFGMSSAYARMFNKSSVITFRGKITGITIASPINGVGNSVRLVVKSTSGGSSLVELGPQWYVNHQKVQLHLKDNVTVTGSKIMLDGRGSIMASKVVVNRKTLVLRDGNGQPYWAADSLAFSPAPVSDGTAAQPIAGTVPVARVPVVPYNAAAPVYLEPAIVAGTIDHFNISNGDVFMVMNVAGALRNVYLGPDWYIERQDVVLTPGDVVTATLLTPSNPALAAYAQSIIDNGRTLYLRNNVGQVIWAPVFPSATITP